MILRPPVPFVWKGNHHSYYGIWFIGFGIFNWYMAIGNVPMDALIPFWKFLIGTGLFMLIDDIIEHKYTADTPLRIIYEKIVVPLLYKIRK